MTIRLPREPLSIAIEDTLIASHDTPLVSRANAIAIEYTLIGLHDILLALRATT